MPAPPPAPPPVCRRCGQCCAEGGPALHLADLPLVRAGILSRERLVTLRRGETVRENVAGGLAVLEKEMVKIAWAGEGHACLFHDSRASACLIHADRPSECRALFCEETSAIEAMYRQDRLTRSDCIDPGSGLWEIIAFHDRTYPASRALALARATRAGGTRAAASLRELAAAEDDFRRLFLERTGASPAEMNFLFGRPLIAACRPLLPDWP